MHGFKMLAVNIIENNKLLNNKLKKINETLANF